MSRQSPNGTYWKKRALKAEARLSLTDERQELIKDLRHFSKAVRAKGREIEADVMAEAADALSGDNEL